ncbi:hypothetical protein [Streptacidiphilus cavernicola]|uniref:Uncharacterized protein n=1 Tax=Streptacidiphilus cavernicola TaxID=3342716 RepID=A0ABV6W065_9ACTN
MSFEETIIKSLQALRVEEGITPAKLGSDPLLMQLLQAPDGADGVERLKVLCDKIPGDMRRIATMNALALDYPARGGIEARRTAVTTHPHGGTAKFPFSTRTHRRREDEGFAFLAWALLQEGLEFVPGTVEPPDVPDEYESLWKFFARLISDIAHPDMGRTFYFFAGVLIMATFTVIVQHPALVAYQACLKQMHSK